MLRVEDYQYMQILIIKFLGCAWAKENKYKSEMTSSNSFFILHIQEEAATLQTEIYTGDFANWECKSINI